MKMRLHISSSPPGQKTRAQGSMTSSLRPTTSRPFVLNHLPAIFESNEISTAIIRILLGLSTVGARTQYLMCANLLSKLLGVADDFARFKNILRDVLRSMHMYATLVRHYY